MGPKFIVRVVRQRYAIDTSCAATALTAETDPACGGQPRGLQLETKFLRLAAAGVVGSSFTVDWKLDVADLDLRGDSMALTAKAARLLADLINRMHPGRAAYREVPEMSHDLHRWASPEEYMMDRSGAKGSHPFQEGLFAVMMPWLERLV